MFIPAWTESDPPQLASDPLLGQAAALIDRRDWKGLRRLGEAASVMARPAGPPGVAALLRGWLRRVRGCLDGGGRPHSPQSTPLLIYDATLLCGVADLLDAAGLEPSAAAQTVLLHPHNIHGRLTHYFHFALGMLVPMMLSAEIGALAPGTTVLAPDCGPMNPHLAAVSQAYGWSVQLYPQALSQRLARLDGLRHLHLTPCDGTHWPGYGIPPDLHDRLRAAGRRLAPEDGAEQPVLLIERAPPQPFYIRENGGEWRQASGSARRSLPNIAALQQTLAALRPTRLVQLEDMALAEQIALFRSSRVIVAQHGAALANLIWCRPGTYVIEILPCAIPAEQIGIFRNISAEMGLRHRIVVQGTSHAPVDIPSLVAHLTT